MSSIIWTSYKNLLICDINEKQRSRLKDYSFKQFLNNELHQILGYHESNQEFQENLKEIIQHILENDSSLVIMNSESDEIYGVALMQSKVTSQRLHFQTILNNELHKILGYHQWNQEFQENLKEIIQHILENESSLVIMDSETDDIYGVALMQCMSEEWRSWTALKVLIHNRNLEELIDLSRNLLQENALENHKTYDSLHIFSYYIEPLWWDNRCFREKFFEAISLVGQHRHMPRVTYMALCRREGDLFEANGFREIQRVLYSMYVYKGRRPFDHLRDLDEMYGCLYEKEVEKLMPFEKLKIRHAFAMRHPLKILRPMMWSLLLCSLLPYLVCSYPSLAARNDLRARLLQHVERSSYLDAPEVLEETINEVQQILNQDPSLPRLTRGEIEELYEKVTREEYQKSLAAGDKVRADSMRALMLVLPYNTDNNTEENLQELFTRPPVTKVIDSYTSHQPIQFLTPSGQNEGKMESIPVGMMDPTTYKPNYVVKQPQAMAPNPTTYHPSNPPSVLYRMTPSADNIAPFKPLATDFPSNHAYDNQTPKSAQRFSSHYSAKDVEFLKMALGKQKKSTAPSTSTIKPVADILESMGIVSQTQSRHKDVYEDYYAAESAQVPQVVSVADLKGLQQQSLAPKIKPDAYSMFKPLNIGEEIRVKPEVEGYLTRFGIVGGRKRKAIKKNEAAATTQNALEQLGEGSEVATAKVPSGHTVKGKKSASGSGGSSSETELAKLLENLRELERLNVNPKAVITTPRPTTTTRRTTTTPRTTTSTTTTTTTTTTTPQPLITNGEPLLIEPKKPRRRIDPNFDINFGSQGNHQTEGSQGDQLSQLLKNLQELENLQVKPQAVLRGVIPTPKGSNGQASRPVAAITPAPVTASSVEAQTLANRFASSGGLTPQQHLLQLQQQVRQGQTQPDLQQLQLVLQQLQAAERANAKTTTTTTTRTPVVPSLAKFNALTPQQQLLLLQQQVRQSGHNSPADLLQLQQVLQQLQGLEQRTTTTKKPTTTSTKRPLRKLLTDDSELEKLFNQAKARQQQQKPVTTSTSTTTSTTKRPGPSLNELVELQKYFKELNSRGTSTTTSSTTTTTTPAPTTTTSTTTTTTTTTPAPTTTSTTTTTTTTTPRPVVRTFDEERPKKQSADQLQLQELINRVQQLERLNNHPANHLPPPLATDTPLSPLQGFTTRNVKAPQAEDYRLPVNDFANLRTLYSQVEQAQQRAQYGEVEISTKATAAKAYEELYDTTTKRSQNFAQRIIDITNDTGSGSSLSQVDANEFVQLQKLLSKVQELERVRINLPTPNPRTKNEREVTPTPSALQSAASQRTQNVQKLNGAQIVYPNHKMSYEEVEPLTSTKDKGYKQFEEMLLKDAEADDLRLDLPTYKQTLERPQTNFNSQKNPPRQEPQTSSEELKEIVYAQPYVEGNAYKDLQPPMIHKTVTKEPPRFVATKGPLEVNHVVAKEKMNLEELQKLLNNAQELKKLGISLPKELTEKLETKFEKPVESLELNKPLDLANIRPVFRATTESPEQDERISEKTAVFSLTTMKSLVPRPPKTTTESTVEKPVFSATKIIEAAIKRAANQIGVSTEFPGGEGFRRRADDNVEDLQFADSDDDMVADFSEFNYQMALPEGVLPSEEQTTAKPKEPEVDFTQNLSELQRLIKNLEELQKLNISSNDKLLRQADAQYLESLKRTQKPEDDTVKTRRQSDESTEATSPVTQDSSMANPTRVQLNLNLGEVTQRTESQDSTTTSTTTTTTEEPRNGSLADLEDSFGPDPVTESPPPPKKKNGFYFLADWNSFLEVGDGDDQVVVRLSPKIGDPRLFLPVKIP
ncbi:mucin-4-like [Musca vetustissima]|uniref:mucin-4-like n=1 Tax=Musca vetustissima TaxID=27455 RepID=UPI002AB70B14|nr:mucin-4-like [Musca vetustissima]